jgi:hypothetical protein
MYIWDALIPTFGFVDFVHQQLQAKEKTCQKEMRTALWNSSRKKASEEPSKPTLKDMPFQLTNTSFFQRKEQKPVINDENDISEEIVVTDTVISSDLCGASECKEIMMLRTSSHQLGKNQTGHSSLSFRRACLELCALLHNNKADTARRMKRLCPDAFDSEESCRMSLTKWAKRQDILAELKFEEQFEYYLTNGSLKNTRNTDKSNPLSPSSRRASSMRPGPRPQYEALEVQLVDHIRECHRECIAVTQLTVIHKALELLGRLTLGKLCSSVHEVGTHCSNYRCHGQVERCKEHGIIPHPIGRDGRM